eukprot:1767929-Rhodomonas_salina.5
MQETAFSAQIVPEMRFLAFEIAVYMNVSCFEAWSIGVSCYVRRLPLLVSDAEGEFAATT